MWYSVFFFFKQKTAYDMRISDWSSDVCSSDLVVIEQAVLVWPRAWPPKRHRRTEHPPWKSGRMQASAWHADYALFIPLEGGFFGYRGCNEIGRASCRERVCRYV